MLRGVVALLVVVIIVGCLAGLYLLRNPIPRKQSPEPAAERIAQAPVLDSGPALTANEIAERAFPNVVMIVVEDENGNPFALGSGFFVRDNILATNHHVINNAYRAFVKVSGQDEKYVIDGIVADDGKNDLALLKLNAVSSFRIGRRSQAAAPLRLAVDGDTAVGDTIYAVGNPEGLESTFSQGIVSGFREIKNQRLIQITAPISHGSSGGPVLNNRGEVIGVAVGSLQGGQNVNFAIPVAYLSSLMTQMKPVMSFAERAEVASDQVDDGYSSPGQSQVPRAAKSYYAEAVGYENEHRYADAIRSYDAAISRYPEYVSAYVRMGNCYTQLKLYEQALAAYRSAANIDPDTPSIYVWLAMTYAQMGQYDDSVESCKRAIRARADDADAHYVLGAIYANYMEDRESALEEYRILKGLDRDKAKKLFDQINK